MALLIDPAQHVSPAAETLAHALKPKYLPDIARRVAERTGSRLDSQDEKIEIAYHRSFHPYLVKQIEATFSPEEIQIGVDHNPLFIKNASVFQNGLDQFMRMAMVIITKKIDERGTATLGEILENVRKNEFDCPMDKKERLPIAMKYAKLLDEQIALTRPVWDQLMGQMGREMVQHRRNLLGNDPIFDQIFGRHTVRWVQECKDLFPNIREELTRFIAIALIDQHSERDLMTLSALSTSQIASRYLQKWTKTLAPKIENDMDRLINQIMQIIASAPRADDGIGIRKREMIN